MNIQKIFINSLEIFFLSFLCHFVYDIIPCFFTSIFFPVNESIFEHLKMLFTAGMSFTFISYFLSRENNLFLRSFIRSTILVIILLILYLPIYYLFGEILILTLVILFISIIITEFIISTLPLNKDYKLLNIICLILIIISYVLFTYITYNPPKTGFFYDTENNKYGVNILDN